VERLRCLLAVRSADRFLGDRSMRVAILMSESASE